MHRPRLDFALCRILFLALLFGCGNGSFHESRPMNCYQRQYVPYDWRPLLSDGGTASDAGAGSDGGSRTDGGASSTCVDTPYGCLPLDCPKLCGYSQSDSDSRNSCTPTMDSSGNVGVVCSIEQCEYGWGGCG
jgi:hypothetical protein